LIGHRTLAAALVFAEEEALSGGSVGERVASARVLFAQAVDKWADALPAAYSAAVSASTSSGELGPQLSSVSELCSGEARGGRWDGSHRKAPSGAVGLVKRSLLGQDRCRSARLLSFASLRSSKGTVEDRDLGSVPVPAGSQGGRASGNTSPLGPQQGRGLSDRLPPESCGGMGHPSVRSRSPIRGPVRYGVPLDDDSDAEDGAPNGVSGEDPLGSPSPMEPVTAGRYRPPHLRASNQAVPSTSATGARRGPVSSRPPPPPPPPPPPAAARNRGPRGASTEGQTALKRDRGPPEPSSLPDRRVPRQRRPPSEYWVSGQAPDTGGTADPSFPHISPLSPQQHTHSCAPSTPLAAWGPLH
jgi:hypothetical protein